MKIYLLLLLHILFLCKIILLFIQENQYRNSCMKVIVISLLILLVLLISLQLRIFGLESNMNYIDNFQTCSTPPANHATHEWRTPLTNGLVRQARTLFGRTGIS